MRINAELVLKARTAKSSYRATLYKWMTVTLLLFSLTQIASAQENSAFDDHIGKYAVSMELLSQTGVEILVKDGKLYLKNAIGIQIELTEDSQNQFHLTANESVKLSFKESETGAIDAFVIAEGGQKTKFTRLELLKEQESPIADTANQKEIPLPQLAGKYARSGARATIEQTTVEMFIKDDVLHIRDSQKERELVKEDKNRFGLKETDKVKFSFIPFAEGGATSFVLARAGQNLIFTRLDILNKKIQALYDLDSINPKAADYRVPEDTGDGLPVASLADVGANEVYIYKLLENIAQGGYGTIDSLLILKDGKLVVEQYYGEWSRDDLHLVQSVSKSITAMLVGSAIRQGHIDSVKDPIAKYLPDYAELLKDGKEAITIQDLLSMSAGLDWDEGKIPYPHPENIRLKELQSEDSVAFTLSVPMINKPGEIFTYSGGYVTVAGEIIKNATGEDSVLDYWHNSTFAALGIEKIHWNMQNDGRHQNTAGGVMLRPRAMAKLGQVMLDEGLWQGKRVLDAGWVKDSLARHVTPAGTSSAGLWDDYGYFWWGDAYRVNGKDYEVDAAQGWGGQEILIIDDLDLVVVITATNYETAPSTADIMTRLIMPAWIEDHKD